MGKIMRFASESYVQSEVEARLKTLEPQENDIPKVFINGIIPTTKDDVLADIYLQFVARHDSWPASQKDLLPI